MLSLQLRIWPILELILTALGQVNKVVLAYSGGLDTSVILKWLQETYECEVVTFTADLGQVRMVAPFSNS